ncbi:hypothetical protein ACIG63_27055 [Streptomyces antimycoticus]|uniref:hypothetical protein n=1 Tax=Streptomyces antimycoticus TaxID=68175 RepID=UPI0037D8720F
MKSPTRASRAWYFFSSDLPEGEILIPIKTPHGLAFAVRPGKMAPEMLDELNRVANYVLNVGLARIDVDPDTKPPERKR